MRFRAINLPRSLGRRLKDTASAEVISISLSLLSRRDQVRYLVVTATQLLIAVLDLLGIALIGLLSSIAFAGIRGESTPGFVQFIVRIVGIEDFDFQIQVAAIGITAALLLISKTVFSAIVTKRIITFLNLRTAEVTTSLLRSVVQQSHDFIKFRSHAELLFAITRGAQGLMSGVLGALSILFSEISLLILVLLGVFLFDPIVTLFTICFFSLIGLIQSGRLGRRSQIAQTESAKALIESEKRILEMFLLSREIYVRNAQEELTLSVNESRRKMAFFSSRNQFLPYISKYTMEVSLVIGSICLAAIQFVLKDAISAISTLSVFLIAAYRLSPAFLRLQQARLQFRGGVGQAQKTLALMKDLKFINSSIPTRTVRFQTLENARDIVVDSLSFRYRGASSDALTNVTLRVQEGSMTAIVGTSGSGKSTLLDLVMGVLNPTKGSIQIGGIEPRQFIQTHKGYLGYVAQESNFFNTSIRDNLIFGLGYLKISDQQMFESLKKVGLSELVFSFPDGLRTELGSDGINLSVGQRQRLSIARALITKPRILLLDEPTSSLDMESESAIGNLIDNLKGEVTVLVVAHRLTTIRRAEQVIKLRNGEVESSGSYSEVLGSH